jgi:hypothetical protein
VAGTVIIDFAHIHNDDIVQVGLKPFSGYDRVNAPGKGGGCQGDNKQDKYEFLHHQVSPVKNVPARQGAGKKTSTGPV